MKNRIPDRWENYSNVGKQIEGTRFICFKVPLKRTLCDRLENQDLRFTPMTLVDHCKQENLRLGLVIDLTNTDRYYHYADLEAADISHMKIKTQGHMVPAKEVRRSFFNKVDKFLEENCENDSLIGVHCTHGLNRTGYLVCRYMIDRLGMKAEEAIAAFNKGRGHDLERENYLEDLKTGKSHEDPDYVDSPQEEYKRNDRGLGREMASPHKDSGWRSNGPRDSWRNDRSSDYRNSGHSGNNGYRNNGYQGDRSNGYQSNRNNGNQGSRNNRQSDWQPRSNWRGNNRNPYPRSQTYSQNEYGHGRNGNSYRSSTYGNFEQNGSFSGAYNQPRDYDRSSYDSHQGQRQDYNQNGYGSFGRRDYWNEKRASSAAAAADADATR